MLYSILLPVHSIVRWLVVIAVVAAVVRAFSGWFGKKAFTALDNKIGLAFTSLMDLQLLIGLILYVISPILQTAFQDFGGAMSNTQLRFFAVEHILMMVIAVVLAHVGRALSKKASTDLLKHRRAAIWFGLALLVMLLSIPWPFSPVSRPWIRF
ncbi:MAG: hypothetical protein JW987_15420 [Anaerolineaceae bacterium]|nr:hypothetical protein [Anaerolineaceae bacterium]